MTNKDKVQMFRAIVNEMADLYEKKNDNYGDSFGQLFEALGPISGLVPLHNKLDRATNLVKGGQNNFESLEDTFKDLACYAIMNIIERKSIYVQAVDKAESVEELKTITRDYITTTPNTKFNPCETCAVPNNSWNSVTSPCYGCPYYKGSYYEVYCSSNGGKNERE